MPSVGMRRTTRVFGVVKGVDGARVLRSGRRLWPESGDVKLRRPNDGYEWFRLINDKENGGGGGLGELSCKWDQEPDVNPKLVATIDVQEGCDNSEIEVGKPIKMTREDGMVFGGDRMFGNVYSRKRKKMAGKRYPSADLKGKKDSFGDRMFGIQFVRRQRLKKSDNNVQAGDSEMGFTGQDVSVCRGRVLSIFTESSLRGSVCVTGFMYCVLSYMRRTALEMIQLSAFVLSESFNGAFASQGIHFAQGYAFPHNHGICVLSGALQFVPLFSVDFSAIPLCFMYMHCKMLLRSAFQQLTFVSTDSNDKNYSVISGSEEDCMEEQKSSRASERAFIECKTISSKACLIESRLVLHPSLRSSKLTGRNMQQRFGLGSRGIQKRRSTLRRRRARNLLTMDVHKPKVAFVHELVGDKKRGICCSSIRQKRSTRSGSTENLREVSSTTLGSKLDVDLPCCAANILVFESDKGYREEGATVMLEISSSSEWLLVVKKDGLTRYNHKAEKVMKPCSCNRFTHALMWTSDNSWKLEFPDRQQWFIFKDLYKICYERNVLASSAKSIPVPEVKEVSDFSNSNVVPFCRPDSYISLKDDEVSRAMAKKTANYDMDSDDEEWLNKLNNEFRAQNELHKGLSEDNFELMIDALEKGFYCIPDDFLEEKEAVDLCLDLGRREVVEAVYTYWMKKRKQKKLSLLRIFQGRQGKRPSVISKSILRKKRSFKRQPSQVGLGRGKQPSVLKAIAAKRQALEEQDAINKAEEAKVSAKKSTEVAISKRQKAQLLFENADLAAYRAMMALRIAEAVQVTESADEAASYFLG